MTESFQNTLIQHKLLLQRGQTHTLQINVGHVCNLACKHCHVDGGPGRKEIMTQKTMNDVIDFATNNSFIHGDITGGAPEMVPDIGYLVGKLAQLVKKLTFRSNLTLLLEMANKPLFELLLSNKIAIVASFPSTNKKQADSQRGKGVWQKSIDTLRQLNNVGYGVPGTGLELNLVANPTGAFMPVDQCRAEQKFKADLARKWDIQFTDLYTFANIPLGRFRSWLEQSNNLQTYMEKLAGNFNPATIESLMCRNLISVSWDGFLYDCDFNLAAGLHHGGTKTHVSELEHLAEGSQIITDTHCYGCTAGAGFT